MRTTLILIAFIAIAASAAALAQSPPVFVTAVIGTGTARAGGTAQLKVNCPPGSIPIQYTMRSKHAGKVVEGATSIIDNTGTPTDLGSVSDPTTLYGGGYAVAVVNQNLSVDEDFEVYILCFSPAGLPSSAPTFVKQSVTVPPGQSTFQNVFCPNGMFALGALTNAAFTGPLMTIGDGMIWGNASGPQYLGNQPDGAMAAPTGWEGTAANTGTAPRVFAIFTICGTLPNLTTLITSTPTVAGQPFNVFGPTGSDRIYVGAGLDGGLYGRYGFFDGWTAGGEVVSQEQFGDVSLVTKYALAQDYEHVFSGVDGRPKSASAPKASARAVLGVLVIPNPNPVPPATIATVIEFYNQALDHYFITAIPQEISDLDNGVHKGWTRTGQTFNVYAPGSTGKIGRQPVCRAYGSPAAGLDSHFYSANIEECYDTLSKFNDAWLLESGEVFQMELPDTTTGVCPAGDVPIYRVWNNRADSNHRYVTTIALRDQMVARGYIAEGYGPDNVTLCALRVAAP